MKPFDKELIAEIRRRLPILTERYGDPVTGDLDELLEQIEHYLSRREDDA